MMQQKRLSAARLWEIRDRRVNPSWTWWGGGMNEAVAWLPVTSQRNLLHLGRSNVGGAPVWRLPNCNPFQSISATYETTRNS
jgi:hypothetical protein